MLINLSNHPSDRWGDAQSAAAKKLFGGVVDMSFPLISPKASSEDVVALAQIFLNDILDLGHKDIHIMGEMSFTLSLVALAQAQKIRCWLSTSERVSEEKDGKKISVFLFEQFRAYPKLRDLLA